MKTALMLLVGSVFLCSGTNFARADLPAPGKLKLGELNAHTYVDTYYEFNFNTPPLSTNVVTAPQNQLRAFDRAHNQFQINEMAFGLSYDANPVGFDAIIGYGTLLDTIAIEDGGVNRTFANIRRATVSYRREKCKFDFGRFDADFGMEKIETFNNMNYSHSMAFASLQPKYFTGLRYSHEFASDVNFDLFVANGTSRFTDNNRGKTFGTQIGQTTSSHSFGLSYTTGPEQSGDTKDWRHTVGLHGKFMPNDEWTLGADATYFHGMEEFINRNGGRGTANAYDGALYASGSFWTDHTDTLRAEYLRDENGFVTQKGSSTNLSAFTLTHRARVSKNLSLWAEGRFDIGNGTFVSNSGNSNNPDKNNQGTLLVAATFNI